MSVRRKHVCDTARRHLEMLSVNRAPVPVEKIADVLGVTISRTPADDDLSGFMYRDRSKGAAIIGVNRDHSPNRQRFTIAHEIGHFLLHENEDVHVDHQFQIKRRDKTSSEGTDIDEQEANLFAAELLMPQDILEKDLDKVGTVDLEDERTVADLAKRYRVSTQAMTFRLAYLGYLNL